MRCQSYAIKFKHMGSMLRDSAEVAESCDVKATLSNEFELCLKSQEFLTELFKKCARATNQLRSSEVVMKR